MMTGNEKQIAAMQSLRAKLSEIITEAAVLTGWMPTGFAMGRINEAADLAQEAMKEIDEAIKERSR